MIQKKQVVFYYATIPSFMIYKIAKMLRKRGYETVLITMCEKEKLDKDLYAEAFDKILCSNFQFFKPSLKTIPYILKRGTSLLKFLISMKLLKPHIIIGISGNNWQLKLAHKYFFKKYPFIYFPYDIQSQFANFNVKSFEIKAERYCFENSQGVMHKGDPNELKLFNGKDFPKLNLPENQLSFLPYCSDEFIIPFNKNKISKKDNNIHLVYIGSLSNDPKSVENLLKAFNQIFKQGIHLHVYSKINHLSKKQEKEHTAVIFDSIKKNKYLHIHKSLSEKEIIPKISKYDYGIFIYYYRLTPEDKFCTGNKIATYLEAGIPLIVHEDSIYLSKLVNDYKMGFTYNSENLKNLKETIKKINYKKIEENLKKARQEFNMEKNFSRLESFIKKVIEKKALESNKLFK